MLTVCFLYGFLFLFCGANFAGELPQPRNNSRGTKGAGNHDPDRPEFCLLQPRPGNRETARTAGRSGRAGAFTTPALSACSFFRPPESVQGEENRQSLHWRNSAPNPAHTRLEGQGTLPLPKGGHTAAHTAKQGENTQGDNDIEKKCFFFVLRIRN